jgi:hypothetical protein
VPRPCVPKITTLAIRISNLNASLLRLLKSTQLLPLPIINPRSNNLGLALRNLDLVLNAINLIDSKIGLIADLNIGRSLALSTTASEPLSRRDWL